MANHRYVKSQAEFGNFRGNRFRFSADGTTLVAQSMGEPWPILATRLATLGLLKSVEVVKGKVELATSLNDENLKSLLAGHSEKRRNYWKVILPFLGIVFILLAFIPFAKSDTKAEIEKVRVLNRLCSEENIRSWLEGHGKDSLEIQILGASILGGVTSGTLECEHARYSYTLGSEVPKRVLMLKGLDT